MRNLKCKPRNLSPTFSSCGGGCRGCCWWWYQRLVPSARSIWKFELNLNCQSPLKYTNALSFYSSKMTLDCPNHFGRVPIVLVGSKSFWSGPKHFGQGQIRLFWANFYNLDLTKMIWTQPKQIRPVQNYWYSTKMIWTVQNHFGPIEGQGRKL